MKRERRGQEGRERDEGVEERVGEMREWKDQKGKGKGGEGRERFNSHILE